MAVIYGRTSGPSARALAEGLGIIAKRRDEYVLDEFDDVDVNWTGAPLDMAINANTETHKLRQLERWQSAGLACIPFSTEERIDWLGRSNYHWGGRDFTRPTRPDFWTQPMRSVKEWRVHVFRKPGGTRGNPADYKVARVGWKVNVEPNLNREVEGVQIRNRRTGWRLQHYAEPRAVQGRDLLARWAIAILGWDFGCVDVLQTNDNPFKWVLLEGNSCPGLKDQATLRCYVTNVGALLNT